MKFDKKSTTQRRPPRNVGACNGRVSSVFLLFSDAAENPTELSSLDEMAFTCAINPSMRGAADGSEDRRPVSDLCRVFTTQNNYRASKTVAAAA